MNDLYKNYFELINWLINSGNYYTHNNYKELYKDEIFSMGTLKGILYSNVIVYNTKESSDLKNSSIFDLSKEVLKEIIEILNSYKIADFKFVNQVNAIVKWIKFKSESVINFNNVSPSFCVLTYKFRDSIDVDINGSNKKVVGITSDYKIIVENKKVSGYNDNYSIFELQHLSYPELVNLYHHISFNVGS